MPPPVATPDERILREFLLGTVSSEGTKQVETWLASNPLAAETLHQFAAHDLLIEVLADTSEVEAVPAAAALGLVCWVQSNTAP